MIEISVENLDLVRIYLALEHFMDSGSHGLYLELLESEAEKQTLPSTWMQLHQPKRIFSFKLPELGYILFELPGDFFELVWVTLINLLTEIVSSLAFPV